MKKYLLYAGMFLGSFLVINVGMYFLLSATQPQTAIGIAADSLAADSLALLHGDSAHSALDTTALAHGEGEAESHEDSTALHDTSAVAQALESLPDSAHQAATEVPTEHVEEPPVDVAGETDGADVPAGEPATTTTVTPMSTKEISKLAKMLEGMKPVEAAAIAERLPDETIVQLVLRMKSRAGAKMMAALPVPIAASVAARMAELSGVGG